MKCSVKDVNELPFYKAYALIKAHVRINNRLYKDGQKEGGRFMDAESTDSKMQKKIDDFFKDS